MSLHHPIPTIGARRAGRAIAHSHRLLDGGRRPGRLHTFVLPSVTSQQVGGAFGLAVLAAVASTVTANASTSDPAAALVSGYTTAFAVAAGITLTAVIVVIVFLPVGKVPRAPRPQFDPG